VPVIGNAPGLTDLIENLIDNALIYAGPGHSVTVSVAEPQAGRVELAVEDDGPGVPDTFLNRLGERFFRVPGGAGSGTGLGLAIVRRIADRHRATVQFSHGARGGLKVTVCCSVPE
jgi:two-component system, OmpR family, sensor histidine kinase TctE